MTTTTFEAAMMRCIRFIKRRSGRSHVLSRRRPFISCRASLLPFNSIPGTFALMVNSIVVAIIKRRLDDDSLTTCSARWLRLLVRLRRMNSFLMRTHMLLFFLLLGSVKRWR